MQSIRVTAAADTDADVGALGAGMDAVAERCPVAGTLASHPDLDVAVERV